MTPRASRKSKRPVFNGDFPDSDRDITEVLERADYDGRTYEFGGASAVGLSPADVYRQAEPATGPPARLRALPPPPVAPQAVPQPVPAGEYDDDKIARDIARGWPHLFEVRCAYPAAHCETPIPCGAVHRDDTTWTLRGLRTSAWASGWHLDALGRWACPGCCQDNPEYRTLYPVAHYHPGVRHAKYAGQDASGTDVYHYADLPTEFAWRVSAEHDLFRDVRDAARHGRHEGGTR